MYGHSDTLISADQLDDIDISQPPPPTRPPDVPPTVPAPHGPVFRKADPALQDSVELGGEVEVEYVDPSAQQLRQKVTDMLFDDGDIDMEGVEMAIWDGGAAQWT